MSRNHEYACSCTRCLPEPPECDDCGRALDDDGKCERCDCLTCGCRLAECECPVEEEDGVV